MNLLEKAMRQKAMRESQTARQDNKALSEVKAPAPLRPAANPAFRRRQIVGAIGVALGAAAIGLLFDPVKNVLSSSLPTQATTETMEQFVPNASATNKTDDDRQNVAAFVDSWGKAWSAKDVDKYLSAYAPEFMPSNGLSRSAWEKQRRHRLAKYRKIEITLANLTVSVEEDTATVEFIQSFKADGFSETGLHKRLDLKLQGARWMIVRETSG